VVGESRLKISEIEDADKLATKQDLELLEARIEKRIANLEVNLIKWMVGMQAGSITLIIGALYLILPRWKA
jgi:hypothetical protein